MLLIIVIVVWKTNQERWMIGTDGERKSEKSVLSAQLNDDDNTIKYINQTETNRTKVKPKYPSQHKKTQKTKIKPNRNQTKPNQNK